MRRGWQGRAGGRRQDVLFSVYSPLSIRSTRSSPSSNNCSGRSPSAPGPSVDVWCSTSDRPVIQFRTLKLTSSIGGLPAAVSDSNRHVELPQHNTVATLLLCLVKRIVRSVKQVFGFSIQAAILGCRHTYARG